MWDPWQEMRRLQREMEHLVARVPALHWPLRGEYPPLNVMRDGNGIVVDASAVESVGQAVLQLLLAARAEAEAAGHRFYIQNPSPAFLARIEALGLSDRLGLSQTEELQS